MITDLAWEVTAVATPRVRVLDAVEPLQLQYAGLCGVGFQYGHLNGGAGSFVYDGWSLHLGLYRADINAPSNVYATLFWWKLPTGLTVDFYVGW